MTKLRKMSQVKLAAIMLIGCLILTSCGGGGDGATEHQPTEPIPDPARSTVALSDLTPDPAQGRVLAIDYSGPDSDLDDLQVYVADTSVEAVVIGDQIHVLLPLTEQGKAELELDIGGDMVGLAIDIEPAPAIAEPDTYAAGVVDDLIAELDVLEGDWGSEIEALIATKQALLDLTVGSDSDTRM